MSRDITNIIAGWQFEPDDINVRLVEGDDGREKVQVRLDLGLLQMEVDGRPDGTRPEGSESWLDHFVGLQRAHDGANPDGRPFRLTSSDCEKLLREGIQYYHRYVSFWHLERFELCARDTSRNLRLFAFVRDFAAEDRDKLQFDQWRPYVTMIHARAVATPLIRLGDVLTAVAVIDAGIKRIWDFLDDYGQRGRAGQCGELQHLIRWREELAAPESAGPAPPTDSPLTELRERLAVAVSEENFEEAARLRDEIRQRAGNLPFQSGQM